MQNFIRNLITEWRKLDLPFENATIIAACSGGADSVSLLLALYELKRLKKINLRIVAAHFNHQLRGDDADADEQFIKNLAMKLNLELVCVSWENAEPTGNLEQNARDARYRFLIEIAENLDAHAVLTAHTLNDQAETFLFNLIRGSGIEGLSGMKPLRNLESSILLARPLLNWAKREDTENFCLLNKVEFRYDSMNEDLKFNRVRIRKILLPMLKDFNPKIIETLAKTAEMLRDDAEHLAFNIRNKTSENEESRTDKRTEELAIKELKDVFPSMRRFILREWLKTNRGNLRGLELKHIEAVERLIFSRKSGRLIELPSGETIIKKGNQLIFGKDKIE